MCWVRGLPSCGGYNVVTVKRNAGLHSSDDWRGMVARLAPALLPRHHRHHSHHQSPVTTSDHGGTEATDWPSSAF